MPVPPCTTWIIRLRTVVATSSDVTRTGSARRPQLAIADDPGRAAHAAVGDRLSDRGHLERRGQHLALANRAHPQLEVVGDRGGDRALGRVNGPKGRLVEQARGRVEAVELGRLDEALRAELGAERREDAVARLREGLGEAPTTGFVVGVGDLTAADHDRGLGRELVRELDHPRLEGRGGRDHLERRARRLRARRRRSPPAPAPSRCERPARRRRHKRRRAPPPPPAGGRGRWSRERACRGPACLRRAPSHRVDCRRRRPRPAHRPAVRRAAG